MIDLQNTRKGQSLYMPLGLIAIVLAAATLAQAQPSSPTAKGQLGERYVDGSFGFSLKPPANCVAQRQKRPLEKVDIELVQFINIQDQWSLSVRMSSTTRSLDTKTIIEGITTNLLAQHTDVKVLQGEAATIASREGVRYAATFKTEHKSWLRQQAVVRTKPMEYYALVFVTPVSDRKVAQPLFDKIVQSFEILRSKITQKRIQQALAQGTKLLRSVADGQTRLAECAGRDNYLRFVMNGKEEGFVHVNDQPAKVGHRKGVEVRQWAWRFDPSGEITWLQQYAFLANDLSYEKWENRIQVLTPAWGNTKENVTLQIDRGMRQDDQLLIAYTSTPNAPELQDKVIKVEDSYAAIVWQTLLPRLVDLAKPELYAFSTYNSERHGLILRTFEVVGSSQTIVDGQRKSTIKLEDSEGLIPPINEIHVDRSGNILRVIAGPLEMESTTRQYIDRRYKSRIDEALKQFKKYPVTEPKVARR